MTYIAIEDFINTQVVHSDYCYGKNEMTYRQFRRKWKEHYKELTSQIRVAKVGYKEAQRQNGGWCPYKEETALTHRQELARKMLVKLHVTKAEARARSIHYGR